MTTRAIALFDERTTADRAAETLLRDGFARDEIKVLGHDEMPSVRYALAAPDIDREYLTGMPMIGLAIGGFLGVMLAIGFVDLAHGSMRIVGALVSLVAIPLLAAALGGAVAVVTGAGLPAEQSEYYLHGVEHGGTLVVVEPRDRARVQRAADIMWNSGAVDLEHRIEAWNGYGPIVTPAT